MTYAMRSTDPLGRKPYLEHFDHPYACELRECEFLSTNQVFFGGAPVLNSQ